MKTLSTAYFPPVQWFTKLLDGRVCVEACEHFHKQTYRNRCVIDSPQGRLALTVPVVHSDEEGPIGRLRLSDHGHWRRQHWQALTSSYGNSPFFEFYEDDLRPFFVEDRWETLLDFNEAIRQKICELLDIRPNVEPTSDYQKTVDSPAVHDFRTAINPKHPLPDPDFHPVRYYQVYQQKHGFLPNLSILDLLLNMGPESIFYL